MTSAKSDGFRLSSKPFSTCEDPRRPKARIEAALRNERNLYRAALLRRTLPAHKLICYAIQAHLTDQQSQTRGVRLAA